MKPVFNVGFSGNKQDLEWLLETSGRIESVYTGGLDKMIAGGRPQYCSSLKEIEELVRVASDRKVTFEIALNSPCGIENTTNYEYWNMVRNYLKDLEKIGVNGIIASHPFIMSEVKASTNMQLTASTICEIQTCRSAIYYENLGADIIVPSMNCNYRLDLLLDMKKALKRARIRLMVNEHCLGDCPWRRFHHSHYAHSSNAFDYHLKCKKVYWNNPHLLLTNSVIRPEDLHHYNEITNEFKIVGRQVPIEVLTKVVRAYDGEQYDGNYVELFDITMAHKYLIDNQKLGQLFYNKSKCRNYCHNCTKCKKMFQIAGTKNSTNDIKEYKNKEEK